MEGGKRSAAARVAIAVLVVCGCGLGVAASVSSAQSAGGSAPGGPGATSYMDVARKDCFGTARNTTSKVWFTVADGVLSDVFSPTIENSNVNTVQYIVTDGTSFADLQQRDMTYTVSSPDRSGMVCRVVSTDASHHFQLVSDYITDPARDSVVVRTTLEPLRGAAGSIKKLKVYVRYDATIDNTGGGGAPNGAPNDATVDPATTALVSSDTNTPSGPFAAQVVGALVADHPFLSESSGFVGTPSDGLEQLDTYHRLVDPYRSADDGHVVQTARGTQTAGRSRLRSDSPPGLRARSPPPGRALRARSPRLWRVTSAAGAPMTTPCIRRRRGCPATRPPTTPRCSAPTGCRPMCSRRPRTRPTSAPLSPRPRIPGASPCRRAPPTPDGHTGRCSRVIATRRSPVCWRTATGRAAGRWSASFLTKCSSPTAASRATRRSTARWHQTLSGCRRSTRPPTRS